MLRMVLVFKVAMALLVSPLIAHEEADETTDISVTTPNFASATPQVCPELAGGQPCTVAMKAESSNCRVRFTEIVATYTVTYKRFGRNDRSVISHTWRGDQCKVSERQRVSPDVRGGDIQVTFAYKLTNGQSGTSAHQISVVGANPSSATVRADLRQPIYEAYTYHISKFRQFAADGHPATNSALGGFGVGGKVKASSEDLWNWKANLSASKAQLDAAWAAAARHPGEMRAAGYSVPNFDADQQARQALLFQRGRSYFQPSAGGGWIKAAGAGNFADKIMQIAADVAAGNPPADW